MEPVGLRVRLRGACGERGSLFAECHRRNPLSIVGETQIRQEDLALLCSNCHRMILCLSRIHQAQPDPPVVVDRPLTERPPRPTLLRHGGNVRQRRCHGGMLLGLAAHSQRADLAMAS